MIACDSGKSGKVQSLETAVTRAHALATGCGPSIPREAVLRTVGLAPAASDMEHSDDSKS